MRRRRLRPELPKVLRTLGIRGAVKIPAGGSVTNKQRMIRLGHSHSRKWRPLMRIFETHLGLLRQQIEALDYFVRKAVIITNAARQPHLGEKQNWRSRSLKQTEAILQEVSAISHFAPDYRPSCRSFPDEPQAFQLRAQTAGFLRIRLVEASGRPCRRSHRAGGVAPIDHAGNVPMIDVGST
jgi:hypothetical protein